MPPNHGVQRCANPYTQGGEPKRWNHTQFIPEPLYLLEPDADRGGRGQRRERDAEYRDRAQHVHRRRDAVAEYRALRRIRSEYQYRHGERQRQQRQQDTAAPRAERETRADGADQAQRETAEG